MKHFSFCLLLVGLLVGSIAAAQSSTATPPTFEFKNGWWFNGKDFSQGTWYVQNGILTKKMPTKVDSVVDLQNRWVVPPLADAHVTCVAGNPMGRSMLRLFMQEGYFYIRILSNNREQREDAEKWLNLPTSPDAAFANGGLTCTLGEPFMQFEPQAWDIHNPETARQRYEQIKLNRKMLGNGYWFLDDKKAVETNWDKIMAQKPQTLTIYLLDSEKNGGKADKGLSEAVAKAVVKKAKKAKIPVVAVIENESDLRLGIKLGVQGFANLPKNPFNLTDGDLASLAKKGIAITPQLAQLQAETINNPDLLEKQRKLLQRMLDKGVPLAIGSNDMSRTARLELNYWAKLCPQENAKILRELCQTTPQAIFPNRKLGKFEEGFEASFLVLSDNPLQNIMKLRAIAFMLKNGRFLEVEKN